MTSRVLGLVRDQVLAFLFGAGDQMDAYNIAFRIPNLVRDLFAEGAMSAAFVPTFTRTLTTEGRERAWRLGNLVVNALLLATGVIVAAGMVFAEPLATAFASAYAEVPGKLELTVPLTRVMFPFLDAGRGRDGADGDAELAAPVLHPGACRPRCSTSARSSARWGSRR